MNDDSHQSWYRNPIVWIVIGIPATSIVVTLSIVWISIVSFDGLVVDDYYRRGLEINRDLARDLHAHKIKLNGSVTITGNAVTLELRSDSSEPHPNQLLVGFYHPTVANRDVLVTLQHQESGRYTGSFAQLPHGKWDVATGTDQWRLEGVFHYPRSSGLELSPIRLGDVK